jgi:hypothetical protein
MGGIGSRFAPKSEFYSALTASKAGWLAMSFTPTNTESRQRLSASYVGHILKETIICVSLNAQI